MNDQQALREYAIRHDAEAFRILVEQYQRLVYSAASRRLANAHDVEEVVQLTFLKLAKAAGAIRRDLAGWVYTTTINTANDLIRRDATRRRHEALAAKAESVSEDLDRIEWNKLSLIIDEVLLELPKAQRSLIVEHFFRGRSQRDLAEELNVSQPTVLRRINGAVDDLRKRLCGLGHIVAAPLLLSALEKIPQATIPATVSAELIKIGLSGAPTAPATMGLPFTGSTLMKLIVGALALTSLIVGAFFLVTQPAPNPVRAAPTSKPIPLAPNSTNPNDWRAAFNNAYALAPNENLRFIPPPPLPARQRYLHEVEQNDTPMPFIQWRWINGKIKREWMQGSGPDGASLASVLAACAGLDEHHVSLVGVPTINGDGDWIVRDGAGIEAILADLHTILLDHFKADVRYEKNEVIKDALVASGRYDLHRIPEATVGDLQVFAEVMDHPGPGESIQGGGTTEPAEFWATMADFLGIPVVDESKHEPAKIDWLLSRSILNADKDAVRRQQILDNITKQTGLVFKQEKRNFTTWKLTAVSNNGKQ